MASGEGTQISITGDVVTKTHRAGTDDDQLPQRLRLAAHLAGTAGCVLAPLSTNPTPVKGSEGRRWQTTWPRVETVPVDPDGVPWEEAAHLLARLHQVPVPGDWIDLPHGWPARMARARTHLARARPSTDRDVVAAALAEWEANDGWEVAPGRRRCVVHGDWHLGQMGRRYDTGRWVLLDIDDLGVGDPAWDLARPAGYWAAGLLPDRDWRRFADAYRRAGGPALPHDPADDWAVLDRGARAAIIHTAAMGLSGRATAPASADGITSHSGSADESQRLLLAACRRMITRP